jgi:hypothetical protein
MKKNRNSGRSWDIKGWICKMTLLAPGRGMDVSILPRAEQLILPCCSLFPWVRQWRSFISARSSVFFVLRIWKITHLFGGLLKWLYPQSSILIGCSITSHPHVYGQQPSLRQRHHPQRSLKRSRFICVASQNAARIQWIEYFCTKLDTFWPNWGCWILTFWVRETRGVCRYESMSEPLEFYVRFDVISLLQLSHDEYSIFPSQEMRY